ncbi:hypothetical protein RIEGSTA812A_PEG_223 [invertebrate metagenome]|uniref:Uncharacterized protein n=1 Tax=invertebrate metagenome TaxID=1711999 RepID=A0A484H5V3_9ZZZZ
MSLWDLHRSMSMAEHGCAGCIVSFNETEDDRLLITLLGLCLFRIQREFTVAKGGDRQGDYDPFHADMEEEEPVRASVVNHRRLLACLRPQHAERARESFQFCSSFSQRLPCYGRLRIGKNKPSWKCSLLRRVVRIALIEMSLQGRGGLA